MPKKGCYRGYALPSDQVMGHVKFVISPESQAVQLAVSGKTEANMIHGITQQRKRRSGKLLAEEINP